MPNKLHVALIEPEIHWNTGNIGRTCVAAGASLHLVGRLGFRLDAREIKRAGLDYWPKLALSVHADFDALLRALGPETPLLFFSARAKRSFRQAPYKKGCCLVFGKESTGLPDVLRRKYADRLYAIPMRPGVRSLNLSTAAGIVIYEALGVRASSKGPILGDSHFRA